MQRTLRLLYLGLNVACAGVYLNAGFSVASLMAREQRTVPDSVDGISFFVVAAPTVLVALLANVAWLPKALLDVSRRNDYRAITWQGVGALVWVATILGGWVLGRLV